MPRFKFAGIVLALISSGLQTPASADSFNPFSKIVRRAQSPSEPQEALPAVPPAVPEASLPAPQSEYVTEPQAGAFPFPGCRVAPLGACRKFDPARPSTRPAFFQFQPRVHAHWQSWAGQTAFGQNPAYRDPNFGYNETVWRRMTCEQAEVIQESYPPPVTQREPVADPKALAAKTSPRSR